MFNTLTESDISKITNWIERYAEGDFTIINNNISMAPLEHILRFWKKNKEQYLFSLLNNQLVFSKEIVYNKPINQLVEELEEQRYKCNSKLHNFIYNFTDWLQNRIPEELEEYKFELGMCIRLKCLATNTYPENLRNVTITLPNSKTKLLLSSGTKIIKFLGKLAKAYNIEGFEDFALICSQVLNQKALKGKLCLSIHPLDYITMSDNNNDWSSCMSWREDGCYRQGTVEMMNSPNVVVAYLESESQQLEEIGWNSKKWRELFIVTPELISGIQGYPYRNENLEKEVLLILKQLANKNLNWNYEDDLIEWEDDCFFTTSKNKTIKFVTTTNFMYNDILHSSHNRLGYISTHIEDKSTIEIKYSGETECIWCGTENPTLQNERFVLCNDCAKIYACYNCGELININEAYEFNGHYYCDYCYDNELSHCNRCNSIVEGEKHCIVTIENIPNWNGTYKIEVNFCVDCYNFLLENQEKYIKKKFNLKDYIDEYGDIEIDYEYLTSKGIQFMNI